MVKRFLNSRLRSLASKLIISRLEAGIYLITGTGMEQAWLVMGMFIVLSSDLIYNVTPEEVKAVVSHEKGHRAHFDLAKRTLYNIFIYIHLFKPTMDWKRSLLHHQEFAADLYAAKRGHAAGLIKYFERHQKEDDGESDTHPSYKDRIERLQAWVMSQMIAV